LINPKLKELASVINGKSGREEKKRFADFLGSPYFNKSHKTAKFCLYLVKCASGNKQDDISEKTIGNLIFGGEAFNKRKFGTLCTTARKLFEEFLALSEYEKQTAHQKSLLLRSLNSRGATKNFDSVAREIEKSLRKETYHDQDYFELRMLFQRILIEKEGIDFEKNLDKEYFRLSEYVDKHFAISKLELINSFLSRKYHVLGKEKADLNLLNEVISYIEDNREYFRKNEVAIFSEYLIQKMMASGDNEKYFHELFEYVSSNHKKFTQEGLELVYYPLINYGSNRAALGDSIFLNYVFRIYQTFEKNGYYGRLKMLQNLDFISIIIISLRVGKTAWTEKFHRKYSSRLNAESRRDTENLSRGLTEFSKKNYDEAIKFIEKVNYINSYYYLKSKETLIKTYYEKEDMQALIPILDSTRHYLNRKKNLLSIHHKRYLEFLRCVSLLIRIKQRDADDAYKLRDELKRSRNVISHEWLLEKLYEIADK
jgi:hypothetical protein